MKFSSSLPYPVLDANNDHYVGSSFSAQIEAKKSFGKLVIEGLFQLQNEEIEQLIYEKKAIYAIHIECPQTSFRKVFTSSSNQLVEKIDEELLRGKIDVHPFILTMERIENYTNKKWNNFYKGYPITYEKGNPLAIATPIEIVLHEEPVADQNLPSIVSIHKVTDKEFVILLSK